MPARPVERDHQLRDEALAVRVLPDERAELGDDADMAAELQLRVELLLERPQAKLLEAIRLRSERDIGQRRAAPEPRPLERQGDSALVLAGGGRGRAVLDERCEAPGVDGPPAEIEPVAAAAALDRRPERLQDAAEPRNVALDGVRRGGRRVVLPELVDEPFDGDDLAGAQDEEGEHGSLLPAADRERAVADPNLDRPEEVEPDGGIAWRLNASEAPCLRRW